MTIRSMTAEGDAATHDGSGGANAPRPRGAIRILTDIMAGLRDAAAGDRDAAIEAAARRAAADEPDGARGAAARHAEEQGGTDTAMLGDVVDRLDERAFGFLMLLLALPCCLPFIYILPQIVALPMLALAAQLAIGRRHPWLPEFLRKRQFSIAAFESVLRKADRSVGFVEKLARPRLTVFTSHAGARIIGMLVAIPAASILVPLPSTNTVPGIGVAIVSLGLIERDGLLVLAGLFIGLAWVALLGFLGFEAASLIKSWVASFL